MVPHNRLLGGSDLAAKRFGRLHLPSLSEAGSTCCVELST